MSPPNKNEILQKVALGWCTKSEAARQLQTSRRTLDRWLQKHLGQAPQVPAPQVPAPQVPAPQVPAPQVPPLQEEVQALMGEVLELRNKLRELAEKEAPLKQNWVTFVKRLVVLEPDVDQHSFSSFAGEYLRSVYVRLKANPHGRGARVLLQWTAFLGDQATYFGGNTYVTSVQGGASLGETVYLLAGVKDPVYNPVETHGEILKAFGASQRTQALEALKQALSQKQEVSLIPVVVA